MWHICVTHERMQARSIDTSKPTTPLPPYLDGILARLRALQDVPEFDQCTINEYSPGVGLSSHVDTHSAFEGAHCHWSQHMLGCCGQQDMRLRPIFRAHA